ncbi:hypothetical protein [Pseudarthrobacter sp. S9]|uniref:hypothetical protein n=1 Tax=Pseudarthrobacter sp. S9 TaxID=3418421 RepID=UPI003D050152
MKLPAARVSALVEGGDGDLFDANNGTPMKLWLVLNESSEQPWLGLVHEALVFVRGS